MTINEDRDVYLSGVFYQRKDADGAGEPDVERLFFASLVSSKTAELTLEGLPLYAQDLGQTRRRSLNGFRRSLRQLERDYPDHGVFVEDKTQGRFEDELASRGIDPEVFFYQIRMNEREGGVSERFSFAEDEDFIDFLLEMTFDQRHARQVREQLGTFRQEIFERNEQLRPELECCRGLVAKLQKLVGLTGERGSVYRDTAADQGTLQGLLGWTEAWIAKRTVEAEQLQSRMQESEETADESVLAATAAERLGAVHHRQSLALRRAEAQAEYQASEREWRTARRKKEVWQAAIFLARVWDARADAAQFREQLERKLKEFAPELGRVRNSATRLANALEHAAGAARQEAASLDAAAAHQNEQAEQARDGASAAGEAAAHDEQREKSLSESVTKAENELRLLREQGILQAGDESVADAQARLLCADEESERLIGVTTLNQEALRREQGEVRSQREMAEQDRSKHGSELAVLKEVSKQADARREALERDAALLRLLQTDDRVDVEVACTAAMTKASDELRRVIDEILRIRVEAAEDERAIHALEETNLLPPSQEVEAQVAWLREQKIRCWSGWEYISTNVEAKRQKDLVRQFPFLATGITVLDADYDRVVEMVGVSAPAEPRPRLRAPMVIAPAAALGDSADVLWTVIGPSSDAHFDKKAGAVELNQLVEGKIHRQRTIGQHEEWQEALTTLKSTLQQFHTEYPRGWFSAQRQKIEIAQSRLDEAVRTVERLDQRLLDLQSELDQAAGQLATAKLALAEQRRQRGLLEQFERSYGCHLDEWRREVGLCRNRAMKSRRQQEDLRRQAQEWEAKSRDSRSLAQAATLSGIQLDADRSKVKYVDESTRRSEAGALEELRSQYELLLADYEGKVNADALSQMAARRDLDAEKEEREFERFLQKLSDIKAEMVEAAMRELPPDQTAQQKFESAEVTLSETFQRFGSLGNRLKPIEADYNKADQECHRLAVEGALPELTAIESIEAHQAQAERAWRTRDEQTQLAAAFRQEAEDLSRQQSATVFDLERTQKDQQRLDSLKTNYQEEFERFASSGVSVSAAVAVPITMENAELVKRVEGLERALAGVRTKHAALDRQREESAKEVAAWARLERFGKLRSSISFRFVDRSPAAMEANAEFDIQQLDERIFQITAKLQEADKHREIVVQALAGAVDEALQLLGRVSRMSKLPERLPQAGQQFVKIETKASDNPVERRAHVGEFIDEQLEHGNVGDGLELIQKAVRRVARRITVRVLHPDLHHKTERVSMSDMRRFSGGERLTIAILLYCTLIRLRRGDVKRRGGSSVLILDNPIGTASRVSFLDMQREVAKAMNVQLIYATAVKDLNAVGALENIIRLRNTRVDRRTGKHFIEVESNGQDESRQVAAARIVFDAAPGSQVGSNGHGGNGAVRSTTSKAPDDA
ncbi:MAG TPA: hypothetical protein VM165_04320 [Planctomycetaceae bacterium]|nr:hypothetical protein [Planctomycetaceae bacterium]